MRYSQYLVFSFKIFIFTLKYRKSKKLKTLKTFADFTFVLNGDWYIFNKRNEWAHCWLDNAGCRLYRCMKRYEDRHRHFNVDLCVCSKDFEYNKNSQCWQVIAYTSSSCLVLNLRPVNLLMCTSHYKFKKFGSSS